MTKHEYFYSNKLIRILISVFELFEVIQIDEQDT